MTYPPGVTTTLPIVAPCPACIHDRVCAIKGSIGMSKVTLTVSILADEVTPRALPVEVVVDCSQFLAASLIAALAIDAALAPAEPIGESAADHSASIPEPVVAAPPELLVDLNEPSYIQFDPPPGSVHFAKPVEAYAPPVAKPAKPGGPVRPLSEPTVPCEPGCGVLIPTSAIGAHRRECEAVKAFKADHVTVVDNGEWPRPLPGATKDVVAARVEFEGKRAAASRSAAAATWDRNHQGDEDVPKSAHAPTPGTGQKRTPEQRERMRLAQLASYERRRAIAQAPS